MLVWTVNRSRRKVFAGERTPSVFDRNILCVIQTVCSFLITSGIPTTCIMNSTPGDAPSSSVFNLISRVSFQGTNTVNSDLILAC